MKSKIEIFNEKYENFDVLGDNLRCICCGGFEYDETFMDRIQVLRWLVDVPFLIAPGGFYRCRDYQLKKHPDNPDSLHTLGKAMDIGIRNWCGNTQWFFIKQAQNLDFSIGRKYPTWLHVDLRPGKPVSW